MSDDDPIESAKRKMLESHARQKAIRTAQRSFARLAKTDDGKRALKWLEENFGWNDAGPASVTDENPVFFWLGSRAVLKAIKDQISSGEKLLANPESNDNESD